MKAKFLLTIILFTFLTGCFFDAYKNEKYGKLAVESWFSTEVDNLGKKRKEIEKIDEIKDIDCKFKEKYNDYYIFKCTINYSLAGETKIPLSKYKDMEVFAVFKPKNKTFDYRVYNSSYDDINAIKEDL